VYAVHTREAKGPAVSFDRLFRLLSMDMDWKVLPKGVLRSVCDLSVFHALVSLTLLRCLSYVQNTTLPTCCQRNSSTVWYSVLSVATAVTLTPSGALSSSRRPVDELTGLCSLPTGAKRVQALFDLMTVADKHTIRQSAPSGKFIRAPPSPLP
jgi:hypothetical protein